jgi:hypothetical protein
MLGSGCAVWKCGRNPDASGETALDPFVHGNQQASGDHAI